MKSSSNILKRKPIDNVQKIPRMVEELIGQMDFGALQAFMKIHGFKWPVYDEQSEKVVLHELPSRPQFARHLTQQLGLKLIPITSNESYDLRPLLKRDGCEGRGLVTAFNNGQVFTWFGYTKNYLLENGDITPQSTQGLYELSHNHVLSKKLLEIMLKIRSPNFSREVLIDGKESLLYKVFHNSELYMIQEALEGTKSNYTVTLVAGNVASYSIWKWLSEETVGMDI